MKSIYLLLLLCASILSLSAQDFSGYRVGNYTGVNGAFFNPANIADSRYRFDINLFSMSTSAGNNQASFNAKKLFQSFSADSLENQLFGKNAGSSSGIISVDMHGPSLMFNTGKKTSFALTTRARVMSNISELDGRLMGQLVDEFDNQSGWPYTISSQNNMRMNVNAWTEFGVTFGQVLADQNQHFFKGGITLKYLAGASNSYVQLSKLNTTINLDQVANEPYFSNTTGRIALGFGGINVADVDASAFQNIESSGIGGDIGFVYEFRPKYDDYKLQTNEYRRDLNKYALKVGVALLDIGGIRYDKDYRRSGAYNIDITGNERFYTRELNNTDLDKYRETLDNNPQYFIPDSSNYQSGYMVALPTTLQLDLDLHLKRGFYMSLASQIALTNNRSKAYNSHYYHSFTLTPRFEGRALGIYVPLNYNELTSFNAGLSLRLGPVFVGSGSVLTALFDQSKQADFHFGLRFGGLQKNKEKKQRRNDKQLQEDYRRTQGRR